MLDTGRAPGFHVVTTSNSDGRKWGKISTALQYSAYSQAAAGLIRFAHVALVPRIQDSRRDSGHVHHPQNSILRSVRISSSTAVPRIQDLAEQAMTVTEPLLLRYLASPRIEDIFPWVGNRKAQYMELGSSSHHFHVYFSIFIFPRSFPPRKTKQKKKRTTPTLQANIIQRAENSRFAYAFLA